jgi:hypothetical protein
MAEGVDMRQRELIYRHRLPVRLWHWTNLIALVVLLASGLQILNAHPRFYWGQYGANGEPAVLAFSSRQEGGRLHGITMIGSHSFDTTGLLGVATSRGQQVAQAFPGWATLPGMRSAIMPGCASPRATKSGATTSSRRGLIWLCCLDCCRR